MGGAFAALNSMPSWAGNVPAWILVLSLLAWVVNSAIKNHPIISQQKIDDRHRIKDSYVSRIQSLERQILEDRERCDREIGLLRDEIGDLQDKIIGIQRQHVQEQISLINSIISSIDAPELKILVRSLESVQAAARLNVLHSQDETVIQPEKKDG